MSIVGLLAPRWAGAEMGGREGVKGVVSEAHPGSNGRLLGNVLRCIEGEKGEQEASHRKHTDRANWRKRGGDLK